MQPLPDAIGNVIVFGPDFTGQRLVTHWLKRLGWHLAIKRIGDTCCDQSIGALNKTLWHYTVGDDMDPTLPEWMDEQIRKALAWYDENQPWVMRDYQFIYTLHYWAQYLADKATAVWVDKPFWETLQSIRDRDGYLGTDGVEQLRTDYDICTQQFDRWPGRKWKCDIRRFAAVAGQWGTQPAPGAENRAAV